MSKFYLLPKIHKKLVNDPDQPVISNFGTAMERISEFVHFHLQPIVKSLPGVIKDSADFLKRFMQLGAIPEGAILCSTDVIGLYPDIPHKGG